MQIKTDKFEKMVKGVKHVVYPSHMKEQIVGELERGELTIWQAMRKYEIHETGTIKRWLKKFSKLEQEQYMRKRTSSSERHQILREIDSGQLTIAQASQKYKVREQTIKKWLKSSSPELSREVQMKEKEFSPSYDQKQLLKLIEEQKLKIAGLETMIDIAEKDFQIPIRKKSGTKQ